MNGTVNGTARAWRARCGAVVETVPARDLRTEHGRTLHETAGPREGVPVADLAGVVGTFGAERAAHPEADLTEADRDADDPRAHRRERGPVTHLLDTNAVTAATGPRTVLDEVAGPQRVPGTWQPLPVDAAVSVAFLGPARVAVATGREPGTRMDDLVVAATASSRGWALVTNGGTLAAAVGPLLAVVPR